ncbi:Uma2 family endonuclease [Streptomyces sp. CB09001]|uniref:Uma2 family endonuclease n=1 Tax=Streptomyces sp. CB09001 TaxID=2083284 RepID=UPI000E2114D5|nr:Uma2 family endonuclease [Streptomyces sp. CB09001]AXL89446.1 Uma2 family endonuclease [Streptomyces sp. CB09001]
MTVMAERPTTSGTEYQGFEELLVALDELAVPDGYRAEITRGSIVVSPWSKGYYLRVMRLVCAQLEAHLPESHVIERGPFLYVFPGDGCAYGPDIHVAHERVFETESHHLDGEALSFVAELTSPATRNNDLTEKVEVYGRAGVPVYLLLDMQEEQATVLWTPSAKGYESRITRPFGEKLPIPAPFDCLLDTAGFKAP